MKFNVHIRIIRFLQILSIALLLTIVLMPSLSARDKLITYPSVIDIEITDESLEILDEPIGIDSTATIELKIGYAIQIPNILDRFLNSSGLREAIAQLWLFGNLTIFPQKIHLEIENPPEWADISFLASDIYIENFSDNFVYSTAELIITPYIDAPNVPTTIDINATAQPIGRIEGIEFHRQLNFQPDYISLLSIDINSQERQIKNNSKQNFSINVTNLGNKDTLITPSIESNISGWEFEFNPKSLTLPIDGRDIIIFSAKPPKNFVGNQTINISFTPQRVPSSEIEDTGKPYYTNIMILSEKNSEDQNVIELSDFEIYAVLVVIAIIILIIIAIIYKRRTEKSQ